ncbi:MAG: site-2 protease family protein [Nanoarchaeota archaeon]|nr:site-2 protease family protein [Nanoarchaeota archaeon]
MRGTTKLFRIFGIDVQLHFSWWFVFALLAWNLSSSFFPQFFPGLENQTYWIMGIISVILLFVSVLLHELSHSLVAKAKKVKVESITLFFFGGVASIDDEDLKPSTEFFMAIAGPLFSLLLFGVFYLIYFLNGDLFWTAITFYLYQLNLILALFNLVPGYPLDGGRAFRALLNAYYKDLKKATRIAVLGGRAFAIFLILFGAISITSGSGGGLWLILLGGFLYFIAGASYEQVLVKDVLSKIPVARILIKNHTVLEPSMRFSEFLERYKDSDEELFLVKNASFSGILDLKNLSPMPTKMQKVISLKQLAMPLSKISTLRSSDSAYAAYRTLSEQNLDFLPVLEKSNLLGFASRRKVMQKLVLALKFGVGVNEKRKKRSHKR